MSPPPQRSMTPPSVGRDSAAMEEEADAAAAARRANRARGRGAKVDSRRPAALSEMYGASAPYDQMGDPPPPSAQFPVPGPPGYGERDVVEGEVVDGEVVDAVPGGNTTYWTEYGQEREPRSVTRPARQVQQVQRLEDPAADLLATELGELLNPENPTISFDGGITMDNKFIQFCDKHRRGRLKGEKKLFPDNLKIVAFWHMVIILKRAGGEHLTDTWEGTTGLSDNLELVKSAINILLNHYLGNSFPTTTSDFVLLEVILIYLEEHIRHRIKDDRDLPTEVKAEAKTLHIFVGNLYNLLKGIRVKLDTMYEQETRDLKLRWWSGRNTFKELANIHEKYTSQPPVVVDNFLNMYRNMASGPQMVLRDERGDIFKAQTPEHYHSGRVYDRVFNIWLMYCYEFRDLYKIMGACLMDSRHSHRLPDLAQALGSKWFKFVEFGPLITAKVADFIDLGSKSSIKGTDQTQYNPNDTSFVRTHEQSRLIDLRVPPGESPDPITREISEMPDGTNRERQARNKAFAKINEDYGVVFFQQVEAELGGITDVVSVPL